MLVVRGLPRRQGAPHVGDDLGADWFDIAVPVMPPSGEHAAFRTTKGTSRDCAAAVVHEGKS